MVKRRKSAEEISEKWSRRASGATADFTKGVSEVTENPAQKAIEAIPKMVRNFAEAAQDGRIEAGLSKVTLPKWKQATIEKGGQRYASGITASKPKYTEAMREVNAHQAQIDAELENMPNDTLEDNIQRMIHQARRMSEFKKPRK